MHQKQPPAKTAFASSVLSVTVGSLDRLLSETVSAAMVEVDTEVVGAGSATLLAAQPSIDPQIMLRQKVVSSPFVSFLDSSFKRRLAEGR